MDRRNFRPTGRAAWILLSILACVCAVALGLARAMAALARPRIELSWFNRAARRAWWREVTRGLADAIRRAYWRLMCRIVGLQPVMGGATLAAARSPLYYEKTPGGLPAIVDVSKFTGNIFYVDSNVGTDAAGYGSHPDKPVATLDYAIGLCTANQGDVILVLPGHAETLTTTITFDVAGVTVLCMGHGAARPQFTINANISGYTITAADVVVDKPWFNEATLAHAAAATIAITGARCKVIQPHLDLGAFDLLSITIGATAHDALIIDPEINVTADGPDSLIKHLGTDQRRVLAGGTVMGSDGTNAFDIAVIDYDSKAVVTPICYGVRFDGRDVATTVVANAGSVVGELMGPNTYAGSATSADNVSSQQEIIDVLYGASGIPAFPTAAVPANNVSLAEVLRSIWGGLMGTAAAENGITTWPAAAAPANTVSLAEAVRYIVETLIGLEGATTLAAKLTAARAGYLDNLSVGAVAQASVATEARLAELDAANLPADVDAILADTGTDGVKVGADAIAAAQIADNAFATEHFAASAGEKTTDGIVITRATAALPQTAAAAIFTVTGLVLLKRIVGYVTVQVGAVANATKLKANSTGAGATTDLCATLDINGDVVDTRYEITGTFANPMTDTVDIPKAKGQALDLVIPPGTIDIDCAGSDGGTGRVRWSATYVPLEAGASVVAA